MKRFQTVPARPEDVDVPLSRLEADVKALVERQRHDAAVAELDVWARMACEHPEGCSCPADYPSWTPGGAE